MLFSLDSWLTLLPICLAGCQLTDPEVGLDPSDAKVTSAPASVESPIMRVNWSEAGDCRSMVSLLKQGLDKGHILDLDETPFLLIDDQMAGFGALQPEISRPAETDLGVSSAAVEARCVLRVGQPASAGVSIVFSRESRCVPVTKAGRAARKTLLMKLPRCAFARRKRP